MAKPGDPFEPTLRSPVAHAAQPDGALDATLPAAESVATLPPGAIVGRYVVEGPLGEGGAGVVYAAHDPQLGRRVALKLLRPEPSRGTEGNSEGRNRLVREAHAMAKLSHPNVVAIHDVGVYGDQVFLAVELVDGSDLATWLTTPRGWREVLEVFLEAGRGLAAAHAAGLVHRDFKPANVLIGSGGVVKVADFGLARPTGAEEEPTDPGGTRPRRTVSATLWKPLTETGMVIGTPGYMAPEQRLGRATDARTDEFSFCAALYRALYDELPFDQPFDVSKPTPVRPVPAGKHVPSWVRRVLLRGLSIQPADRYPTLDALLAALADDPAVRLRRTLPRLGVAVALLAAAGSIAFVVRERAAADRCHDPEAKLADVWDDAVRARERAAFAATGVPDAMATAAYAEKAMDRVSGAWLAAYRDACQATRTRHAETEAALNLRLDCLDDQRFDLRAASELVSHPDPKNLVAAIGAASTLPLPSECADARALSVIEQPGPERRPAVEALRLQLGRGRAAVGAGRADEAIGILKPLPARAQALEATALQARALAALADAWGGRHGGAADLKQGIEVGLRAEQLAEAAHLDPLATEAAAGVAWRTVTSGGTRADVDAALARARQELNRAGSGGTSEYFVERVLTMVEEVRGHDSEAAGHAQRTLNMANRLYGSESRQSLDATNMAAITLDPLGRQSEMLALFRKAVAGWDALLGPRNRKAILAEFEPRRSPDRPRTLGRGGTIADPALHPDGSEDRRPAALHRPGAASGAGSRHGSTWREPPRRPIGPGDGGSASHPRQPSRHRHLPLHRAGPAAGRTAAVGARGYERHLAHQDIEAGSSSWVAFLRVGGWAYLDLGRPAQALPLLERALTLSAAHPFFPGWVDGCGTRSRRRSSRPAAIAGGPRRWRRRRTTSCRAWTSRRTCSRRSMAGGRGLSPRAESWGGAKLTAWRSPGSAESTASRPLAGGAPRTLPSSAPAASLAAGSTIGRYVIEAPLGEGGMGVVYLAHDPQLGRNVALKLLRTELDPARELGSEGRSRLVREAHAMARLNHPNVVTIYDAGISASRSSWRSSSSTAPTCGPGFRRRGAGARSSRSSSRRGAAWQRRMRPAWSTATSSRRTS